MEIRNSINTCSSTLKLLILGANLCLDENVFKRSLKLLFVTHCTDRLLNGLESSIQNLRPIYPQII